MSFGRDADDVEKAEEERLMRNIQKKKLPAARRAGGHHAKPKPAATATATVAVDSSKSKDEIEREEHERRARERLEQQKAEEEQSAAKSSDVETDIKASVRSVFETARLKEAEAKAAREKEKEQIETRGTKESKWKKPEGLFSHITGTTSPPTAHKAAGAVVVKAPTEDSESLSSAPPPTRIPINATPVSDTDSPRTEVLHESVHVPKITYKTTTSPYKKLSEEEKEELRRNAQREAQASLLEAGFLHRDKPKEPEPLPPVEAHVPAKLASTDPALAEAMKLIGQSTPAPRPRAGSLTKEPVAVDHAEVKRRQQEAEKAMKEAGFM
eukprot:TRINITY_DN773_c0_g1_i7.p1 TRINITY_DN773_c0_g1~~TRINITY_DN773_c0_g1_i7.p1  ORF type:complete len:326 (-),score=49.62 TRINITY_DN773_c0_g1_i7:119-1096(-)